LCEFLYVGFELRLYVGFELRLYVGFDVCREVGFDVGADVAMVAEYVVNCAQATNCDEFEHSKATDLFCSIRLRGIIKSSYPFIDTVIFWSLGTMMLPYFPDKSLGEQL